MEEDEPVLTKIFNALNAAGTGARIIQRIDDRTCSAMQNGAFDFINDK
jgi:hypothetical protein